MLLDKAFDLEERRKKVPFVLGVVSTLGRRPGSDCNSGNHCSGWPSLNTQSRFSNLRSRVPVF